MEMIGVGIVSGDTVICRQFKQLLLQKTAELICEEGIETLEEVNPTLRKADYLFIDMPLLQEIPLREWQAHFPKQKLIIITSFVKQAEALPLLGQGIHGLFTKAIDHTKWETVIYHPEKKQTTIEQYFLTQIIPLLLKWEARPSPLEKKPLALEAEILYLLDTGQTVGAIASILEIEAEIVKQYVTVIEKVRSA